MKTDPAVSVSGPAATSLSYQAIESGNRAAKQANLKSKSKVAISDTVETGDREGDGRETFGYQQELTDSNSSISDTDTPQTENGSRLDLTG